MTNRTVVLCAALLLLTTPAIAQAGEACYLLMFGSQRVPADPDYSHTFATFVRSTWDDVPGAPGGRRVESITISWLPANLQVRTVALRAEEGVNLGLHETLRYVLANDERVSMWGPYQIDPAVYCWASRQKCRLESGKVRYKANDMGRNSARVSNCIHAVANVVEGPRLRVASPGWGETASYLVLRRFMPHVIDCPLTHPWVASTLGLGCYPIIYRDFRRPYSGIAGPLFRLFGGERGLHPSYGMPH